MRKFQAVGKYILVKLHTVGSNLEIVGSEKYNGLATVLSVGNEVDGPIVEGNVIMLNGPQGILAHPELGEGVAIVAAPLVLARQVGEES